MTGLDEVEEPARRRRQQSPRRSRIDLSLRRSTAFALTSLGVVAAGGLFGAGYLVGRGGAPSTSSPAVHPAAAASAAATTAARPEVDPGPARTPTGDAEPKMAAAPAAPAPDAGPSGARAALDVSTADPVTAEAAPDAGVAPDAAAPPPPRLEFTASTPKSGFGLQLGAYPTEAEARAFVEAHREALAALPRFLVRAKVRGRVWFRIRVGRFADKGGARGAKARLPLALRGGAIVVRYR